MSEYIVELPESGAADEALKRYGFDGSRLYGYKLTGEIVRCRDCKHMIHFWHHDDERWQCINEMLEGLDITPNFYCAWGEQKEVGE